MKPRVVLLMVLGIVVGPVYYAYCIYFSGRTAQTFPLSERGERWVGPDGAILRFRGGLGYKPVPLALAPDMNPVTLRLRFELPEGEGRQPLELHYQATLFEGEHAVLERAVRVAIAPGHTASAEIGPLEIPYPDDYLFVLEEAGRLAATPGISLRVIEKVEKPNMPVVWTGLIMLVLAFVIQAHALWTAQFRSPAR